ncbi:MAG: NUDIX hydrolase [Candidatus Micrarchaeota archaeon]
MNQTQELNAYLVISGRGKLLLLKRFNDIWEFPGGGVEFGEHPKDSAIRETREETGLKAKNPKLIGITSATFTSKGRKKHATYAVYKTKSFSGKPKLSREHKEYGWYSQQEARKLRLGLNVKPILKML